MNTFSWKKITLGLVLVAVVFLAACNGGEEGTSDSSNSSDGEENTGSATLEVGVEEGYVDFINEIAPAFEEEHGVTIEITEKDMFETLEALPLDGPAGLAPDVMIAPYDRVGNLGQQGHLAEYTLPDDGRYDETDQMQVTFEDKIYGAPFVIEALVLYYNKDLLDEAPQTFEDLEALTEDERFAFGSENGKSTAFLANWLDFYSTYGLLAGYGGYVFGQDGTDPSEIGLNTDGAIEGITYATEWFENVWPQGMMDVTSAGDFIDTQFTEGTAAAIIGGPWQAATYNEAGVNFGVSSIPTLPNGEAYQPFAGGKAWIVSNYAEDKELATEWLTYVTNEENQQTLYDIRAEIPANNFTKETVSQGESELTTAVIEQYNTAVPMPNIPQMAEVWTGAETLMFDAASGNKTPEESANGAVKVIQENIEQKYQ
ncbi:extracellular solute-binding protein [Oceanobacillus halophilus]|uniref:Maltodextrin-binding protein n=1 Tax=Oceanobacillus halophilus TaxID=930130 RepID=A0A494ZS60_9BACI|nr:extracellular solute-binding protein [Oceanobacillus halophilus]RKQ28196.1 extracellular solute-binding protein [Oceanobacillus halophilus]